MGNSYEIVRDTIDFMSVSISIREINIEFQYDLPRVCLL